MNMLNSLHRFFPLMPLEKRIEVQTDRFLRLTSTVLSARTQLPTPVTDYLKKVEPLTFLPHQTRFQLLSATQVRVIQEISFQWGFQPSFRQQIISFWHLVKRTRRVLLDLIEEEKERWKDDQEE